MVAQRLPDSDDNNTTDKICGNETLDIWPIDWR